MFAPCESSPECKENSNNQVNKSTHSKDISKLISLAIPFLAHWAHELSVHKSSDDNAGG